jgi:MFS family permease
VTGTQEHKARRWSHPFGVAQSRWERLAIAIAVGAMGTLGFSITSPLLPDLAAALGVPRASIGLVQAAVSIPGVLLSAVIGYLADRLGRRRVVLTSLMLFATFGAAGFFARSFWALVGARFLQGVGTSGILGLGIVLVGDLFTGPERTKVMGYNLTGVTVVNMLGPIASGAIGAGGVFRPFLIFLVGYPLGLWASRMPSDPPRDVLSPLRHAGSARRLLASNHQLGDFGGVLVATVGTTVLLHGFGYTTAPLFLDSAFGIGSAGRGLIVATFQVGSVVAAVQIGRIRARRGGASVVGMAFWAMGLGAAVTAAAPAWWAVSLGLGISGVGFGLFVPLAQDKAASFGGDLYRGLTVLTWVTFVRVAQVVGPPAGSWTSEELGPRATFALAAGAMFLGATTWRAARRLVDRRTAAIGPDSLSETQIMHDL